MGKERERERERYIYIYMANTWTLSSRKKNNSIRTNIQHPSMYVPLLRAFWSLFDGNWVPCVVGGGAGSYLTNESRISNVLHSRATRQQGPVSRIQ